jgi:hypothetical protein
MIDLGDRYALVKNQSGWSVWDRTDGMALASFASMLDAETCRVACELARRSSAAEQNGHQDAAINGRDRASTPPGVHVRPGMRIRGRAR